MARYAEKLCEVNGQLTDSKLFDNTRPRSNRYKGKSVRTDSCSAHSRIITFRGRGAGSPKDAVGNRRPDDRDGTRPLVSGKSLGSLAAQVFGDHGLAGCKTSIKYSGNVHRACHGGFSPVGRVSAAPVSTGNSATACADRVQQDHRADEVVAYRRPAPTAASAPRLVTRRSSGPSCVRWPGAADW
jgi:hypothetical protein